MKEIDRDTLLALLKHQEFRVHEVTDANADTLRALYAPDLGPGDLTWDVRDTGGRAIVKHAVVYCAIGRPPSYRGMVVWKNSGPTFHGLVLVDDHDAVLWLMGANGAGERMNGE